MKASDIKTGLSEDKYNPKRNCKRYASTIVRPYAEGVKESTGGVKSINSAGHEPKKVEQSPNNLKAGHTKSSKLTELKKKAKKLGITQINKYDEKQLLELIAKADTPKEPEAPADEVDVMRAKIKELGGNLPRGKKSTDPEALKAVLDGLTSED
jgi:hypothetical protein